MIAAFAALASPALGAAAESPCPLPPSVASRAARRQQRTKITRTTVPGNPGPFAMEAREFPNPQLDLDNHGAQCFAKTASNFCASTGGCILPARMSLASTGIP